MHYESSKWQEICGGKRRRLPAERLWLIRNKNSRSERGGSFLFVSTIVMYFSWRDKKVTLPHQQTEKSPGF